MSSVPVVAKVPSVSKDWLSTKNISLPGSMIQRTRLLKPSSSVVLSHWMKLDHERSV